MKILVISIKKIKNKKKKKKKRRCNYFSSHFFPFLSLVCAQSQVDIQAYEIERWFEYILHPHGSRPSFFFFFNVNW